MDNEVETIEEFERKKMEERYISMARDLLQKATNALDKQNNEDLTTEVILKILEAVIKVGDLTDRNLLNNTLEIMDSIGLEHFNITFSIPKIVKKYKIPTMNSKRRTIPLKHRHTIFKKYKYRCVECGATNEETRLEIDHIVPLSKGGTNDVENLQVLCKECNLGKSNNLWD